MDTVTVDNFNRAETDMYFGTIVEQGGFGHLIHYNEVTPVDHQTVIRANRDTLYSAGVFDLDAGPVSVTLPDAGERFMSMMVLDEDQYVHAVAYTGGHYTFTRDRIGTRYVFVAIRIFVDPNQPADVEAVHALQDAIVTVQDEEGRFAVPDWDPTSRKQVHDALLVLGQTVPDLRLMFGAREQVDPVRHLIGSAMAWGGNPEEDATYINVTPEHNDGAAVYTLTVEEVPVDGFWSISVYNGQGYFEPNAANAYSVNNVTAKRSADGAVRIQFGGTTDDPTINLLPITRGWNYLVRLYRPRAPILTGAWTFPIATPA